MPSRAELEVRANACNIAIASYPNDSKLEQAVIYAEDNLTSSSSATTVATTSAQAAKTSGGANV
jgi:hypothetical protein